MKLAPDLSLKDLAPCDARMALSIARFAEEELKAPLRGRLLVALSGGADSTALLIILCALRPLLGCHVEAAHLDHGLRPESAEDALAAAVLCRDLGVPFHGGRADVAHLAQEYSCGVEEAGRRARYAFLEEARISSGADWTLTAHHVGDLAEDVLLRLARGAGPVWAVCAQGLKNLGGVFCAPCSCRKKGISRPCSNACRYHGRKTAPMPAVFGSATVCVTNSFPCF